MGGEFRGLRYIEKWGCGEGIVYFLPSIATRCNNFLRQGTMACSSDKTYTLKKHRSNRDKPPIQADGKAYMKNIPPLNQVCP